MAPAGQSYYPLIPLKYPLKKVHSSSLERLSKDDSDLSHPTNSGGTRNLSPSHSSRLLPSLHPQRSPSPGRHSWHVIKTPFQMALLPLVAIGYLAFCYTVHGKMVPVTTFGLYDITPQHLTAIKGGVTSISIIVVSIALYPIYDVVSSLRSEEFFRVLASQGDGVQLETINHVLTPTYGKIATFVAIWKHTCSNYYILATVASLLVWIVATLAPGALTINRVLADGELMAFAIGAVPAQSVLNGTNIGQPSFNASAQTATAASISWAEMELGVQYSFGIANTSEPDYAAYIAPVPIDLSTATSARWLTDVIGVNPTCSWTSTNLTTPVQLPFNSTSVITQPLATAYLPDFNLDVQIAGFDLPGVGSSSFATVKDPIYSVTNHTTHTPPSDGSTVFLLGQCQSGCSSGILVNITLDLTSVDTTFTIAFTDRTWTLAILTCIPNIAIETREMRNDGHGILTVHSLPAGSQLRRQGNLYPVQTNLLFSFATMSLTQSAGPLTGPRIKYSQLGSQVQGDVLYGKAQFDSLPVTDSLLLSSVTVTLAPIEDITNGYTQIIQSAAKAYLGGYLGTAYVPGRISASEIVFAVSIPNLAISTAVFVLLFALITLAQFRPGKGMEFTLVNVAAAVHGSELPAQFAQTTANDLTSGGGVYGHVVDAETDQNPEMIGAPLAKGVGETRHHVPGNHQDIVEAWGKRRVFMQRRVDGSPVLHLDP